MVPAAILIKSPGSVAARVKAASAAGAWLLLGAWLSGCGQKGPLTLAQPLPAKASAASAASSARSTP